MNRQEPPDHSKLDRARIERIKRRLKSGYYLSDRIARATAAKILKSQDRTR